MQNFIANFDLDILAVTETWRMEITMMIRIPAPLIMFFTTHLYSTPVVVGLVHKQDESEDGCHC